MIGIAFHCGICLLLFALLTRIDSIVRSNRPVASAGDSSLPVRPWLATIVTAFFAFNPCVMEMVIWTHLHGYLLFLVFLLGSMNLLLRHISGPNSGRMLSPSLWGAWVLALLSAFTYELGQMYAVLAGLFLAVALRPRQNWMRSIGILSAFVAVFVIYQAANHRDLEVHQGQFPPDEHQEATCREAFTTATLSNSFRFALYTAVQPFCPSLLRFSLSGDRLEVHESLWDEPIVSRSGPIAVVSVLVLGLIGWFGVVALREIVVRRSRLAILLALLFSGLWGVYAAGNILGRMNLQTNIGTNSYYSYPALLFGLTVWFTLVRGAALDERQLTTWAWQMLLAGLIVLSVYGGVRVRAENVRAADELKWKTAPIRAVHKFIQRHRHEPDFSVDIDYLTSDPIPEQYGKRSTDIVFSRWISSHGKYRIAIRHRAAVIVH